jgi:hypothetical protein
VCSPSGKVFEHNELDEAQIAADKIGGFLRPRTPALAARRGEHFACPALPARTDDFSDYEMRDAA